MIRWQMIQHVEELCTALQKCDNSWVAEEIIAHKIKNKRDNLMKKMPDNVTPSKSCSATPAQGRPRPIPSASSSFSSTLRTAIAVDEDYGDLDNTPSNIAETLNDIDSDTSFQVAPPDLTTAATRRAEIKSICNTPPPRRGRGRGRPRGSRGGARGRGGVAKQQSTAKTHALPIFQPIINNAAEPVERKPSRKIRENQEIEEVISAKRQAEEEVKEGRAKVIKKSRANLEELFKKWAQDTSEVYEEVEREILWLGGVKFLGSYEDYRQIWTQAEPDEVDVDDEVIED
jgi:hypothetical protein